jgi:hypothetical protein
VWECEFERDILPKHLQLRNNPLVQHTPINTLNALYGGRIEDTSLHKTIDEELEAIDYCDVSTHTYGKFHVGHPVIYLGDDCRDINAMFKKEGLINCLVMPPKKLYHPVLPYTFNQKLHFCLCRTCAEAFNMATECTHCSERNSAHWHMGHG